MIASNMQARMIDLKIASPDDPRRLALYSSASRTLDLSILDFLTIRDLLDITGLRGDLPLEAALICAFDGLSRGSLCLDLDSNSRPPSDLDDLLSQFDAESDSYRDLIGSIELNSDADVMARDFEKIAKPLIVLRHAEKPRYLYFQKHLASAIALRRCLSRPSPVLDLSDLEIDRLRGELYEVVNTAPYKPNPDQLLALCIALLRPFVAITGGPGTGKTTIVFTLLRCLTRAGISPQAVALVAPTGRAAQRLTESIRINVSQLHTDSGIVPQDECLASIEGRTIHRLLKYNPRRNMFSYNSNNPLPVDVLVIDEVSMVDAGLMASLLSAIKDSTRVILLGDANQLPSVEAGAVLADLSAKSWSPRYSETLVERIHRLTVDLKLDLPQLQTSTTNESDSLVRLTQNHRSASAIAQLAELVNNYDDSQRDDLLQRVPKIKISDFDSPLPECCRIEAGKHPEALIDAWVSRHYLSDTDDSYLELVKNLSSDLDFDSIADFKSDLEKVFKSLSQARILTATRSGRSGCERINEHISRTSAKDFDPQARGGIFAGMPIMITANDYDRSLYNGDVGVILQDKNGIYRAVFARGEEFFDYAVDMLPPNEPAFAMTVHKSQGSEYDCVLLILPNKDDDSARRILTREIVYTGLTRAKSHAMICSDADTLCEACARQIFRTTGLELLQGRCPCTPLGDNPPDP